MAQHSTVFRGQRKFAFAAAVAAFANFPSAFGDVIDIAPGGTLTIYNAPSVFDDGGSRKIQYWRPLQKRKISFIPISNSVTSMISSAAERYSIDPHLLVGLAWQESHFHHDAISPEGAVGIMQLMAGTARELGVDRYDFSQNILGGAAYLRQMLDRYGGDPSLALAAYNAGPNAVDRYRGIPPFLETKTYVNSIMSGSGPAIQYHAPFVTFAGP